MATEATVASGRYPQAVHLLDAGIEVTQVACPRLVPLIQSGDVHGEELHDAARGYASVLKDADADTVILGCTHYPLIRPMLQRIFGRGVTLITSAEEIAREAAETVARRGVSNDPGREGAYRFMCTGDPAAFRDVAGRFLQLPLTEVERVDPAALAVAA
jgi:glutamate racemase